MLKQFSILASILLLFASSVAFFSLTAATNVKPAQNNDDNFFEIVQITDTQYLSWMNSSLYYNLTNWIVTYSASYNLRMVIHTGDIVDTPNDTSQWAVANTAFMTLLDNKIPYCWNAGNHDQLPPNSSADLWSGDPDTDWLGSQYSAFNLTLMRQKSYWVSDIFDGKNTAVAFNFLNYRFLIINMEFLANKSVLNWMKTLINSNPDANVIVATHDYLNRTGGYGTRSIANNGVIDFAWGNQLRAELDKLPNVFLTISGHIISRNSYNQRTGNREEIFFNRQEIDNKTGAASVRIYSFNLTSKLVSVSTYALNNQAWLTDSANQFSFSINSLTINPSLSSGEDSPVVAEVCWIVIPAVALIVLLTVVLVLKLRRKSLFKKRTPNYS